MTALLNGVEGQHNKNLKKFSHHIFLAVFLDAGQEVHAHHLSALEEPKSRSVGMKYKLDNDVFFVSVFMHLSRFYRMKKCMA